MKLIINADDFGLTSGVNQGILDAMTWGAVTSTTMLVNTPGTEEAARIARERPELPVGLHLNVSLGTPLTCCHSLLQDGYFVKPSVIRTDERYDQGELLEELSAQYARFLELTGRKPTHLDSHLYTHQRFPKVALAARTLAQRERLPLRDMATGSFPRVPFTGGFRVLPGEREPQLLDKCICQIEALLSSPWGELMVHPGRPDSWLMANSSYNVQRQLEYNVLTSPGLRDYLHAAAVTAASFQDVEEIEWQTFNCAIL